VRLAQGEAGVRENFRIRWNERAEHGPADFVPPESNRASRARLIDWAENGIEPSGTSYSFADGRVRLASTAAERGGIQPVASATANGASRADVGTGEPVTLTVTAAVPRADRVGHALLRPSGDLLPTARATSHRTGDVHAEFRRIETIAQARTVVL
jgi:hypothetical protein